MQFSDESIRVLRLMKELIETPSVVGYYPQIHQMLAAFAAKYGYEIEEDKRHTVYIRVKGKTLIKYGCLEPIWIQSA